MTGICPVPRGGAPLLMVTNPISQVPAGGRALLSRLNYEALAELWGDNLLCVELPPQSLRGWRAVAGALHGQVDGLTRRAIAECVSLVEESGACKVFLDGSNLGKLAAAISRACPGVEVTTFFHNCESRFFLGALRQNFSIRACGVLLGNYVAERAAVRRSDKRICLNARDSQLLTRIFGRGATHIAPMAMEDQLPAGATSPLMPEMERYALFVGGSFYANRQGIDWYVDHVAARAPIKLYVVGKGFEQWKDRLERNGNVEVVGAVDHVAPWYLGATFVIAPIFDGSGMKTKVAEALMFGKRVVGTPEAFVGYEMFVPQIGRVCETATEFVAAMEQEVAGSGPAVDPGLRAVYETHFSKRAARERLAEILAA